MSETDFAAYMKRSTELKLQQAALEVVRLIRSAIDGEYVQRHSKGNYRSNQMHLNVRVADDPAGHFPIGVALWYTLQGKNLLEQRRTLEEILAPHVENGDIPEFHIREAVGRDSKTHLVINYNFPL